MAAKKKRRFNRAALTPFVLLIPWFIGIGVFRLYPILISFWYSLHNVTLLGGDGLTLEWVGFDNFYALLLRGGPLRTIFGPRCKLRYGMCCWARPLC